jgi:hypothetical protein
MNLVERSRLKGFNTAGCFEQSVFARNLSLLRPFSIQFYRVIIGKNLEYLPL